MEYEKSNLEDSKKFIIDGKGNVESLLRTIKDFTGLTFYATDESSVIDILMNPNEYVSNESDIDKLVELRNFIEWRNE